MANSYYGTAGPIEAEPAAVAAPAAPTGVSVLAISDTSLKPSWDFTASATYYDVYRAPSSGGSFVKINTSNVTDFVFFDTGLAVETEFFYKVKAVNGTGESAFSAEASGTTNPTNSIGAQLIASMLTKIRTISGFSSENVQVGESIDLDNLIQEDVRASNFPRAEIIGASKIGQGYVSQRDLESNDQFQIFIHAAVTTENRTNGPDMQALMDLSGEVRTKLSGFHDDEQAGSPPSTGFLHVLGDVNEEFEYELFSDKLNTAVMTITFRTEAADTLA